MDILKNTITVKKDQFEENVYKGMNRSLEDAYNILLSRFENQTEVSYYSELSILLTNSDGEVYEMPDYTHIHSVKDSGSIEAYNFNDGLDCMRKVSIVNDDVVLERYNFRENKVRATLYKLTPATMKLAREYSHKDRDLASYAAKEIVGGYFPFICTLQKQSDVEITADNSDPFVYYLLCDGERVAEFAPGRSFYRECSDNIDYFSLLKKKAEKGNAKSLKIGAKEEK